MAGDDEDGDNGAELGEGGEVAGVRGDDGDSGVVGNLEDACDSELDKFMDGEEGSEDITRRKTGKRTHSSSRESRRGGQRSGRRGWGGRMLKCCILKKQRKRKNNQPERKEHDIMKRTTKDDGEEGSRVVDVTADWDWRDENTVIEEERTWKDVDAVEVEETAEEEATEKGVETDEREMVEEGEKNEDGNEEEKKEGRRRGGICGISECIVGYRLVLAFNICGLFSWEGMADPFDLLVIQETDAGRRIGRELQCVRACRIWWNSSGLAARMMKRDV